MLNHQTPNQQRLVWFRKDPYVSSRNFVDSPNRLCVCIWVPVVAGWLVAGLARVWRASPPSLGTSNQFTGTGTWSPALSCTRVALLQGDGG